ncbi:hypothetical protein AB0I60_05920 [Actinosynnema sp. NPDC050436]|uniref:Fic family protein n=1 Tax=Actinosynnema sp. NPDC050436 TaxID=3155659 RepID=UPI0033E1D819
MRPASQPPRERDGSRGAGGPGADTAALPVYRFTYLADEVEVSPRAHALMCLAEHAAGAFDHAVRGVADPAALVTCLQLRDVLNSARLAGHTATPVETWQAALVLTHHDRSAPAGEAGADPLSRFIGAARLLEREISNGRRNDIDLHGEVSAALTGKSPRSAREGLRRDEGVLAAAPDSPPYARTTPPAELGHALAEWDRWVASPLVGPRLVRIAVAHAVLELSRPYPEANGHVSQLFSSAEMVRRGLTRDLSLSLSYWLDERGEECHRHLRDLVRGGPWSPWVEFFARGVHEQAVANLDLVEAQAALREELRDRVADEARKSPALRAVVAALPTAPVTSSHALTVRHGISPKTAWKITQDLERNGTLRVLAQHPFKIFVCDRAMDVLTLQRAAIPQQIPATFAPEPPR